MVAFLRNEAALGIRQPNCVTEQTFLDHTAHPLSMGKGLEKVL